MSEAFEGKPSIQQTRPQELLVPDTREAREQNWQRMSEYFRTVTDTAGTPIDEKVFDTVVGLNLLGVETRSSDEGHAEGGYAYPFIRFAMPDDILLQQQLEALDQNADTLYEKGPEDFNTQEIIQKYRELDEKLQIGRGLVFQRVTDILSAFYRGKTIDDWGRMLAINGPEACIEPNGSRIQGALGENERKERLEAFQEEMEIFGLFLKDMYIEGESAQEK